MTVQRRYSDFDLVVERSTGTGYRARVMASPAGEADGSFTLPFSDLELENFMLKVGRPRRGTRRLESPEMEAARQFGAELFGAVFQDDVWVPTLPTCWRRVSRGARSGSPTHNPVIGLGFW